MPAESAARASAHLDETLRLEADAELTGTVAGEIIVPLGVTLVLHGVARSDVIVEKGGRAIIHGTIVGCLINLGGDAEIFGTVDVIADAPGVSTRIHAGAVISGRPMAPPKGFASGA
jgi:cytoskeletal protein CcmA (bactofilin family)